jgi:hypothetical protein
LADHYCDDVMTDVLKRRDDVVSEGWIPSVLETIARYDFKDVVTNSK